LKSIFKSSEVKYFLNNEDEIYGTFYKKQSYSIYENLLQNLTFENCVLDDVDFSYCDLSKVKFKNNKWGKTQGSKCNFTKAIIIDTELPPDIRALAIKDGAIYSRDQLKRNDLLYKSFFYK